MESSRRTTKLLLVTDRRQPPPGLGHVPLRRYRLARVQVPLRSPASGGGTTAGKVI